MTAGGDPALAYLDARDRLLRSVWTRLARMCNAEIAALCESLAARGNPDDAAGGDTGERP